MPKRFFLRKLFSIFALRKKIFLAPTLQLWIMSREVAHRKATPKWLDNRLPHNYREFKEFFAESRRAASDVLDAFQAIVDISDILMSPSATQTWTQRVESFPIAHLPAFSMLRLEASAHGRAWVHHQLAASKTVPLFFSSRMNEWIIAMRSSHDCFFFIRFARHKKQTRREPFRVFHSSKNSFARS